MKRPSINLTFAAMLPLAIPSLTPATLAQPVRPSRIELRQTSTAEVGLIREGAFLFDMRGELRRTQVGWVMDFAPDSETGQRLTSMVLQRGMTLTAMEQIIAAHHEPIDFVVSGQVFVYHNRNYLLPTRFAITTEVVPTRPQAAPEGDLDTSQQPFGLPGLEEEDDEPSIEDLLEGIGSDNADDAELPISFAAGSAASLREGRMIAQVRGRVLPGAGGDLIFTQDSDSDPDATRSELPPLHLMPCLNVERLEKLRLEWGDRLIVSMSGRIFIDAGRPVILPTMYVVELERSGNLSLGQ